MYLTPYQKVILTYKKHVSQRIGNASIEWLMIRGLTTIKKEEKMIGGLE